MGRLNREAHDALSLPDLKGCGSRAKTMTIDSFFLENRVTQLKRGVMTLRCQFLFAGAVLLLVACSEAPEAPETPPRPVVTLTLEHPAAIAQRRFSGRAEAAERTALAFRVPGEIIAISVDVGDQVEQGEELARLDERDFRLRVQELEASLEAAAARLHQAERNYRRGRELIDDGVISRAEFDNLEASYHEARAGRDATREGLETARAARDDTVLKAPFPGYIAARLVEPFEQVSPQRPVLILDQLNPIEIRVGIPEPLMIYRGSIIGMDVHFETLDESFDGRIKAVGVDLDAETQTYPVRIAVANPDHRILPGMTAEVAFRVSLADRPQADSYLVPLTAVFERDGQHYIWVFDAGQVHRLPVVPGTLEQEGVRVMGELEPGMQIVTAGVGHLEQGQAVRLLEADGPLGARQ